MRRVYTIGETVMDIIFKDNVPVAAKAGGSMLNVSVSLGRLKVPVSFISEFAQDQVGEIINNFLKENCIDTRYIYRYIDGKSAIALAFLDDQQKATYSFYKSYPAERFNIDMPPISSGDIVMFGSYFGIAPEIRPTLIRILTEAKACGAIIIYDPNFRKAHLHNLKELLPFIKENFRMADIIKGSDEDFDNIFGVKTAPEAFLLLNDSSKTMIFSKGKYGVDFCSQQIVFHCEAKDIETVSTIGAGDNFNAGLAFGLVQNQVFRQNLLVMNSEVWKRIIQNGVDFASEVCLSYDNYLSENYASDYLKK
jgi:fructokinase